ncbi:hypothetical protein HK101_009264 [Irineochytrium annulatum]|nr:hypothetical protein HK101_009264 [Irineochytrium annulatum]
MVVHGMKLFGQYVGSASSNTSPKVVFDSVRKDLPDPPSGYRPWGVEDDAVTCLLALEAISIAMGQFYPLTNAVIMARNGAGWTGWPLSSDRLGLNGSLGIERVASLETLRRTIAKMPREAMVRGGQASIAKMPREAMIGLTGVRAPDMYKRNVRIIISDEIADDPIMRISPYDRITVEVLDGKALGESKCLGPLKPTNSAKAWADKILRCARELGN